MRRAAIVAMFVALMGWLAPAPCGALCMHMGHAGATACCAPEAGIVADGCCAAMHSSSAIAPPQQRTNIVPGSIAPGMEAAGDAMGRDPLKSQVIAARQFARPPGERIPSVVLRT